MNGETDPLDVLLIDHREIDRKKLAAILSGRVGIDRDAERVVLYSDARDGRTIPDQVLLFLLGQRVLNLYREEVPKGLTPQELSRATGIKGGSLRPSLARLADEGLVDKQEARYYVPSRALDRIAARLGVSND